MAIPTTEEEYLAQVRQQLTALEKLSDGATGMDERLDITNRVLIHVANLLSEGVRLQLPKPSVTGEPPYNVRTLDLSTAKTTEDPEEVELGGDMLTFYTDGTLAGVQLALDSPVNDWIPISEFGNPYHYPAKFQKFYLVWTEQSGRYLRVHVGREAGAEASIQLITTSLETRSIFAHDQVAVGTTRVQIFSTSFPLWFGMTIKADNDNAGDIYVGDSTVTTANGVRLTAGESITMEISNANLAYAVASVAAQEIQYLGI